VRIKKLDFYKNNLKVELLLSK